MPASFTYRVAKKPAATNDEEQREDHVGELEEGEFNVERIMDVKAEDGVLKFERTRVPYVRKMATLEELKKLIAQRDIIDKQIAEQEQILKENGVDMHSSLIDSEGFPLANVDVYSVRHARQAVICARDDRQKLTDRIEALMHELHAITKQERPSPKSDSKGDESEQPVHRRNNHPFARVDKVSSLSPAQQAKIRVTVQSFKILQHAADQSTQKCILTFATAIPPIHSIGLE
ncbi:putative 26S proteasome non-ATPase regulatory subunit 9 [Toxocara canis]|uniref:Putative 26S proteasome non-ATPase regulatory subunit 9 n=1 Tax=Toxocara canis TaxID=6265 RepID=A0A0B2VSR8_TOXCA|nr:putative 26S proteasome non-ATPase regulatory subunit 9 [Toxocara canis]